MFGRQIAMVFAHPGHEYAALGMIQKLRPQILYLTQANSGDNEGREKLALRSLTDLGLEKYVTFLHYSEPDIQREALSGKVETLMVMIEEIRRWFEKVQPDTVFGDAYEHYNFIHDLVRLAIDAALEEHDPQYTITNCEVPLALYGDRILRTQSHESAIIQAQQYQFFPIETLHGETKRQIIAEAGKHSSYMLDISETVHEQVYRQEPYFLRTGPRDYTRRSDVSWKTYDEFGRDRVAAGRYDECIQFEKHFLPLVKKLRSPNPKAA